MEEHILEMTRNQAAITSPESERTGKLSLINQSKYTLINIMISPFQLILVVAHHHYHYRLHLVKAYQQASAQQQN